MLIHMRGGAHEADLERDAQAHGVGCAIGLRRHRRRLVAHAERIEVEGGDRAVLAAQGQRTQTLVGQAKVFLAAEQLALLRCRNGGDKSSRHCQKCLPIAVSL